jgi:3'-phosphoadenosine 5'-phosphosulfate sulfotransferase (PAPS reductase)/FAD synthetase
MLRDNAPTARTFFETPEGLRCAGGESDSIGTRRKFPMQTKDLSRRWCSASLKIDVASLAIRNQSRFKGARTVYVSGERAEEGGNRAYYADVEPHRTHLNPRAGRDSSLNRHVTHWRPVLRWREADVWDALRRHRVRAHPCYYLHPAIGHYSCQTCIFASAVQWRIVKEIDPERFARSSRSRMLRQGAARVRIGWS